LLSGGGSVGGASSSCHAAWEKVVETAAVVDVTSILVTGLNLDAAKAYHIFFSLKSTVNAGGFAIYFNGDDTDANYHTQQLYASGSLMAAGALASESRFTYAYTQQRTLTEALLMRSPNNYTMVKTHSFLFTGSQSIPMWHTINWNSTENPVQIEIRAPDFQGIGAGSKLTVLRLRS